MTIQQPKYPPPARSMTPRSASQITDMVIHHTAGNPAQTPLEIDRQHRNQGWAMIGYNLLVDREGHVFWGRPILFVPSAVSGHNTPTLNICLIGWFHPGHALSQTTIPAKQKKAFFEAAALLHGQYPIVRTRGHRDYNATACPGNVVYNMLPELRAYLTERRVAAR